MAIDISESLLKAMSITAVKAAEDLSSDKTVKAIIKKCLDASSGRYQISYNSGTTSAYLPSGSTEVYQTGEQVYVLVPQGDMAQKKFIMGRVQDNDAEDDTTVAVKSLLSDYQTIGANPVLEKTYKSANGISNKKMQPLALDSHSITDFQYCYVNEQSELYDEVVKSVKADGSKYDSYGYPIVTVDEESFANAAKQAEALLVRAKFKAALDTATVGNYGVIVNIAFSDSTNPTQDPVTGEITYPPKVVSYALDCSKMTGNPMKYYDYSSQYMFALFEGEKFLYIDSIIAFCEGFVSSKQNQHSTDDDIYIYMDDLEVLALDEISSVDGDYKLQLTTPNGNTIQTGETANLTIQAKVTYQNSDVTDNTLFYWAVKDPVVTSLDENYNAKTGTGYKYLKDIGQVASFSVTNKDLSAAEMEYKCVAIYKSDIILKTTVKMFNSNNKMDIAIESDQGVAFQFNEGNPTLTCTINGSRSNYATNYLDSAFSFIWSKADDESGTILLNETEAELTAAKKAELQEFSDDPNLTTNSAGRTAIQVLSYYANRIKQVQNITYPQGTSGPQITCKLKDVGTYVTYACSVYCADTYVGYAEITLQNSSTVINNNYHIAITNDGQVFQYNESGVSPASESNAEPIEVNPLTAVFYSPQGEVVTPKSVEWLVPVTSTLIDMPNLNLKTDDATGETRFVGDTFPLAIKEDYDLSAINNQVTAIVTHSDGTEYRKETSLLFTKVGEIGTNGTDTVVKITEQVSPSEGEYLTIIKGGTGFWNDEARTPLTKAGLDVKLFSNNIESAGYTAKWTIAGGAKSYGRNYSLTSGTNNAITIGYVSDSNTELDGRIVKAAIDFGGKYYYGYYGIPAIEYNTGFSYDNYPIKVMRSGTLRSVLYNSDGTTPSYAANSGGHIEFGKWAQHTGYLDWSVEGGSDSKHCAFTISRTASDKKGSTALEQEKTVTDLIIQVQDEVEAIKNLAPSDTQKAIDSLTANIGTIVNDSSLPTSTKITSLADLLEKFHSEHDNSDIYARQAYSSYYKLYTQILSEFLTIQATNSTYLEAYNKIQSIWQGSWPAISGKTHLKDDGYVGLQGLITAYKKAYEDRNLVIDSSNDKTIQKNEMPVRTDVFDETFCTYLKYIDGVKIKSGSDTTIWDKAVNNKTNEILIEYTKVMMAYVYSLFCETLAISNTDATTNIADKYKSIFSSFLRGGADNYFSATTEFSVGEMKTEDDFATALSECGESIDVLTDTLRSLYTFYQQRVLKVAQYTEDEQSVTLTSYIAIINGQTASALNQVYVIPNTTYSGVYQNNNLVARVYYKDNNGEHDVAKVYIPIIMTLNTYELGALNGWDGTAIEINEDEGYIMTPQIGAGVKDATTNTFTGMVMGAIGNPDADKYNNVSKIGLAGYSAGRQSMFLDSTSGKATFGLAGNEDESSEGRIILNPYGESSIGNWKIGSRYLANVVDGAVEKRRDSDARSSGYQYRLMVPHDKYGVILSADQPYLDIKGIPFEDDYLDGIDYSDEYNSINPGDGLELRLNPGNKSLFSIVQHTCGLNEKNSEDIRYGYCTNWTDSVNDRVIKSYVNNENVTDETEGKNTSDSFRYCIYKIDQDENGNPISYYNKNSVSLKNFKIADESGDLYSWKATGLCGSGNDDGTFSLKVVKALFENEAWQKWITIGADGLVTVNPNKTDSAFKDNGEYSILNHSKKSPWTFRGSSNFIMQRQTSRSIQCSSHIYRNGLLGNLTYKFDDITTRRVTITIDTWKYNLNNFDLPSEATVYFCLVPDKELKLDAAVFKSEEIAFPSNKSNFTVVMDKVVGKEIKQDYSYDLVIVVPNSDNKTIPCNAQYLVNVSTKMGYKYRPDLVDSFSYGHWDFKPQTDTSEELKGTTSQGKTIVVKYKTTNSTLSYLKVFTTDITERAGVLVYNTRSGETIGFGIKENATDFVELELEKNVSVNSSSSEWGVGIYPYSLLYTDTVINNFYTENKESQNQWYGKEKNCFKAPTMVSTQEYGINVDCEECGYTYSVDTEPVSLTISSAVAYTGKVNGGSFLVNTSDDDGGVQATVLSSTALDDKLNETIHIHPEYKTFTRDKSIDEYGYIKVVKNNDTYYKYIRSIKKEELDEAWKKQDNTYSTELSKSVTDELFTTNEYWKDRIRVGLDENGRLYSNSHYQRKTFSRTGSLLAFNNASNIYGLEVRAQKGGSEDTSKMASVIKIFTQPGQSDTTYMTAGRTDDSNISIRTAGQNSYVELASSTSTTGGTIPDVDSNIRVGYKTGITFNASSDSAGQLTSKQLAITTPKFAGTFGEVQRADSGAYSGTKTANFIVASDLGLKEMWKPSWAISKSMSSVTSEGHQYRILGTTNSKQSSVCLNADENYLSVSSSMIMLANKSDKGLKINDAQTTLTGGTVSLTLQEEGSSSFLRGNTGIEIYRAKNPDNSTEWDKDYVKITSERGGLLQVGKAVSVQADGGLIVNGGTGEFKNDLYTLGNFYSQGDVYVGYNLNDNTTNQAAIRLYGNRGQYTTLTYTSWRAVLYWYNFMRWITWIDGNTLNFTNIGFTRNTDENGKPMDVGDTTWSDCKIDNENNEYIYNTSQWGETSITAEKKQNRGLI